MISKDGAMIPKKFEQFFNFLLIKSWQDKKEITNILTEFVEGEFVRWRDELGDVTRMKKTGNKITDDLVEGSVLFATNTDLTDYLITNIQLNHDRELKSVVRPHIHFWQAENNIPNFLFEYRWQKNLGTKTTDWTRIKTKGVAKSYVDGIINQIALFDSITPPLDATISDILQFRIIRDNANGSGLFSGEDPYTTGVHVTSFDVHIKVDSNGSTEEYVK